MNIEEKLEQIKQMNELNEKIYNIISSEKSNICLGALMHSLLDLLYFMIINNCNGHHSREDFIEGVFDSIRKDLYNNLGIEHKNKDITECQVQ